MCLNQSHSEITELIGDLLNKVSVKMMINACWIDHSYLLDNN